MSDNNPARKINILVAEDNEVNQKVIRIILERKGYQFEMAADGLQAVALYRSKNFDLVLMDCQMPLMNGLDAASRIRSSELELQRARCPIVALTANVMSGDREKCLAIGMDDFLAKPFLNHELLKKIETWAK